MSNHEDAGRLRIEKPSSHGANPSNFEKAVERFKMAVAWALPRESCPM